MKKFIYAIMFAVLPVMALSLASCNDDDNLPDVKVSIDVENAAIVDGTIYVVQGDTLNVASLTATNNEAGKSAALTNVKYYIDGFFIGQSFFAPYPAYCITDAETPAGNYNLGVTCTVLAPDKSIAIASLNYPIKVVASQADMPNGAEVSKNAVKTVSLSKN